MRFSRFSFGATAAAIALAFGMALPAESLQAQVASIVACAQACVARSGVPANRLQALYLTGGSSALAPLGVALGEAFPGAQLVTGDRLGSVAAGLAYGGAAVGRAMAVES